MRRHRFTKRKTRAQRVAFRVTQRREYAAEIRASREEWNQQRPHDLAEIIDRQHRSTERFEWGFMG